MKLVLFAVLGITSKAFVTSSCSRRATTLGAAKSDPEEYLSGLWNQLKITERDIVVQENIKGTDENDLTKHLIEELLETALEHVKTKEQVEAQQAKEAHEKFEHAVEDEQVLQEFVEEERLRDVAMDGFVMERLHTAQEAEKEAMKEEDDHVRAFEELRNTEASIKEAMEELKRLEP